MTFIQTIPSFYKVPGIGIEVDSTQAGTAVATLEALLTGHMTSAGTATPGVPVACASKGSADTLFGQGSMLSRMVQKFIAINQGVPLLCLPIAPATGAAATGSVSYAATSPAAGTYYLYVAGQLVQVAITSGMTAAQVATAVVAAVTTAVDLPVTAAVDGTTPSKVNFTCKWAGSSGGEIRIEENVLGTLGGQATPTGLVATYPTGNVLAGGSGNPDFSTAIPNLGDQNYEWVGMPFTDAGSLAAWAQEYGFSDSGRWGWQRETYGQIFSAHKDTYANLYTWGQQFNYPTISVMADELQSPTPTWELAAIYAATASSSFAADPGLPLQTLPLVGHTPAPRQNQFIKSQINSLATVGLAIKTAIAGVSTIMREQTQYQLNAYGRPDNAYELATTLATLAYIFRALQTRVTQKFGRCKLADDGTPFGAGQTIATPKTIKAELVAHYLELEEQGVAQQGDQFAANLQVVRSQTEPNTVEVYYPPAVINQLRRFNVRAGFRLHYTS